MLYYRPSFTWIETSYTSRTLTPLACAINNAFLSLTFWESNTWIFIGKAFSSKLCKKLSWIVKLNLAESMSCYAMNKLITIISHERKQCQHNQTEFGHKQRRRLFDEMKSHLCFSNNFQSMLRWSLLNVMLDFDPASWFYLFNFTIFNPKVEWRRWYSV